VIGGFDVSAHEPGGHREKKGEKGGGDRIIANRPTDLMGSR